MRAIFPPRPSVSHRMLLQALKDNPQGREELQGIVDGKKLFFGVGEGLDTALIGHLYPGEGFQPDIKFDLVKHKYSLTETGLQKVQEQPKHRRL